MGHQQYLSAPSVSAHAKISFITVQSCWGDRPVKGRVCERNLRWLARVLRPLSPSFATPWLLADTKARSPGARRPRQADIIGLGGYHARTRWRVTR